MYLLRIFPIFIYVCFTKGQWVDPHSMDTTNVKDKLPVRLQKTPDKEPEKVLFSNSDADIHLRRVVRLILSNAYLEDDDIGYYEGHVNLKLSTVEHQFLINFSKSTVKEEKIFSEVSSILESALQKPSFDKYHEMALSMQEKFYELLFNPTSVALAVTCLCLYILYRLIMAEFTWRSIVKYFFFMSYIIDAIIIYLDILRDREVESMVHIKSRGVTPPECNPENMSWWTYAKTHLESTFFENPCKAYYQATFDGYKYLVAPSKVFVRQFKTFIEPVGDIGEAFGKFGRGMFTSLPWGLNVVLFPVMLISSFVIIFIIFVFITKPHFKLSLFHLFSIELGQPPQTQRVLPLPNSQRREIGYGQDGTPRRRRRNANNGREVVVKSDHRALVEDVSNSSHGSEQKEPLGIEKRPSNSPAKNSKQSDTLVKDNGASDNSNSSKCPLKED